MNKKTSVLCAMLVDNTAKNGLQKCNLWMQVTSMISMGMDVPRGIMRNNNRDSIEKDGMGTVFCFPSNLRREALNANVDFVMQRIGLLRSRTACVGYKYSADTTPELPAVMAPIFRQNDRDAVMV